MSAHRSSFAMVCPALLRIASARLLQALSQLMSPRSDERCGRNDNSSESQEIAESHIPCNHACLCCPSVATFTA